MNWPRLVASVLSLAVLASILAGAASAQPSGGAPSKAAKEPAAQVATPKALQGPVKVGPTLVKEAKGLVLPPNWDAELDAHNALRAHYAGWIKRYTEYMHRVDSCLNQDHTVADQKAAGCLPSDTLAVCMDKIYNACLAHPSRKMAEVGMSGLLSAAETLSAEAASLARRIPNALPKFRDVK